MNLSWFVTYEFLKTVFALIGLLAVAGIGGGILVGWLLSRGEDFNRHSSYPHR